MKGATPSPKVVSDSWGELEIEGVGPLRDAKLWPGGAASGTGTRRARSTNPGSSRPTWTSCSLDPEVIVLSRGRERRLQTQPQTLAVLRERNIEVVVEETSVAITTYNRLSSEGRRVAALVHSTC